VANILIVDDSLTIAKFVEGLLLRAGHIVSISGDAEEAVRRLSIEKFDLILLDVVMPGKNGFQLCREIKTNPQYAQTPVIIMSTKNTDIDKYWGRKQGADEYLVKPVDSDILLAAVNRFVPSGVAPQPVAASVAAPVVASVAAPAAPSFQAEPPVVEKKSSVRSFFSRFGFG
jgi:DNA-binding response OmpR family regulator